MTSGFYESGLASILTGEIDLESDSIAVFLLDSGNYTVDLSADSTIEDIPDAARVSETTLTGKTVVGGVFDCDAITFASVTGTNADAIALFVNVDDVDPGVEGLLILPTSAEAIDPDAHDLGGSQHAPDTLAALNTKISDATLDDSSDPRTDADAIHDNVAGEIAAITTKATPVSGDLLIIEDSADSNNKKSIAVGSLPVEGAIAVDSVQFDTGYAPGSFPEGLVYWNADDHALNVSTGQGPILQVGQEMYVIVYNGTASQIDDAKAVYPVGGYQGRPSVALANASTHVTFAGVVLLTTMDIPAGQFGICAQHGKVRGVNTDSWNLGDTLWVSATASGELTNVKPQFPSYSIQIGGVTVKDAVDGEIQLQIEGDAHATIINFWNGVFRETFDFLISSDGATITGSLSPQNGHDDMTMMFSDGLTLLDTTPPDTVVLTAGTDANPQNNYVYIPQSSKAQTVSLSGWPSAEHIKIASVALRSAATTQLEGPLRNQNWNDAIENTSSLQGHLSHVCEKIRQFEAQWNSGIEGSVTIDAAPTPDDVYVKTTAGVVYQMHPHAFPLFDMTQYDIDDVDTGLKQFTLSDDGDLSAVFPDGRLINVHDSTGNDRFYTVASTAFSDPDFVITVEETPASAVADGTIGDDIHVVNDSVAPYKAITNLSSQTVDALGNSLANSSFSFVVWGVQNKTGQPQHLMLNLPTGDYSKNNPGSAVSDSLNKAVYTIPGTFKGVGFLIARFTFTLDASGNVWTLYDTEDLRGKIPNTTAGGGAGGTGVTTLLGLTDTPSAYTDQGGKILTVSAGETAIEFLDAAVFASSQFSAGSLNVSANADWAVNAAATLSEDTNNAALAALSFNDSTPQGAVFDCRIPAGATNLIFKFFSRAEVAPGGAQTVALSIYEREIPDNSAITAWSSPYDLTDLDIPTNEYWQEDSQTIPLATLGLTAGSLHQFELVRDTADGGDTLTNNWVLLMMVLEFS
jgi:hypothetical protein